MMMRKKLFLLGVVLFPPAISFAENLDWSLFNTRVDEAEIIFRGTVISKEYRDSTGEYGGVFTIYIFDVHQEFKGESPDGSLVVKTPQGISPSGRGVFSNSGSPAFLTGGNYLLFMSEFGIRGQSVLPGGVMVIDKGPISGNPVLLKSGWQVLDFDENGPVIGDGPIVRMSRADNISLNMGSLAVESNPLGLVDEVMVDFEVLVEKFRQYIGSRELEKTFRPGKKVNHAPDE